MSLYETETETIYDFWSMEFSQVTSEAGCLTTISHEQAGFNLAMSAIWIPALLPALKCT